MSFSSGGKLYGAARRTNFLVRHFAGRHVSALRHGLDVKLVLDRRNRIGAGDILLFACLRNELPRIPAFLEHYRRLGVRHFLFVDNDSTDGFLDAMRAEPDVSVWHTSASYRRSNFGMHWLNALLRRYGTGRWCVVCDPDEFLVYPHHDTRPLPALARYLEATGRSALFALMVDMYPEGPVEAAICRPGQNPVEVAPWYDRFGYVWGQNGYLRELWVQGGPRARVMFREDPSKSPSLNKYPFVKWTPASAYMFSMHTLVPRRHHIVHGDSVGLTGALLHFKFLSTIVDKSAEELERKEHWDDSKEYAAYHRALEGDGLVLKTPFSQRYEDWRSLVDDGLMTQGSWF